MHAKPDIFGNPSAIPVATHGFADTTPYSLITR